MNQGLVKTLKIYNLIFIIKILIIIQILYHLPYF